MSNEENELLKLYESQYTGRLFEKATSYLLERNALFDEREKLYNLLNKIKEEINKELTFEVIVDGEKKEILGYNQFLYKILKLLEETK